MAPRIQIGNKTKGVSRSNVLVGGQRVTRVMGLVQHTQAPSKAMDRTC